MTIEQINKLLLQLGKNRMPAALPEMVETHISWVIFFGKLVYKIKKPIQYSFLDFSTAEKRQFYCHQEIMLNRRLTENIYIDVLPIVEDKEGIYIGKHPGEVIDHAVQMHLVDRSRQMNQLLLQNKVALQDISSLAKKLASFHLNTPIIYKKKLSDIPEKFADISCIGGNNNLLSEAYRVMVYHAIEVSNNFMKKNSPLLEARLKEGFVRDCHGDLHSRNIFLLAQPQPFDCLEFNEDFRQIDVLNEIAFLCMDLDAFGRQDLATFFFDQYNQLFPTARSANESLLFIYYKAYRSNIRAKVNWFRARDALQQEEKIKALREVHKYLQLMNGYTSLLEKSMQ